MAQRGEPGLSVGIVHDHAARGGLPYWTDVKVPTPEQVREALRRQATADPTETRWKYSNLAFVLAGEIVSLVSGQSYEDFARQRILLTSVGAQIGLLISRSNRPGAFG